MALHRDAPDGADDRDARLELSTESGQLKGYVSILNRTGARIVRAQIVLFCKNQPFVFVDSSTAKEIAVGTEQAYAVSLPMPARLEAMSPKRIRTEAQIAGPPGLIVFEDAIAETIIQYGGHP